METGITGLPSARMDMMGSCPIRLKSTRCFSFDTTGQKGFMAQVLNEQKGCTYGSNQVLGDLYWDPIMIHVEDASGKV